MKNIVPKPLNNAVAMKYVEQVLATGGIDSKDVIQSWIANSTKYALAPKSVDPEKLLDFGHGGIIEGQGRVSDGHVTTESVPTTLNTAVSTLWEYLTRYKQPTVWIHEALLTEMEIKSKGLHYVKLGKCIYLIYRDISDKKQLELLIRYSVLSWHFLAFVTERNSRVTSSEELMRTAGFTLIGAYDGESFLYACV